MKRKIWLAVLAAAGGAGAWVTRSKWSRGTTATKQEERRASPDPEALRAGSAKPSSRVGVNVGALKDSGDASFEPVVEYLTYIQVQRGEEDSSMLFVRQRDLETMADEVGRAPDELVEQLQRLGVVLSLN